MNKFFIKIIFLLLFVTSSILANGQSDSIFVTMDSTVALNAKNQAEKMLHALADDDYESFFKFLNPETFVNEDRNKLLDDIKEAKPLLESLYGNIDSYTIGYPFSFVKSNNELQCVLEENVIYIKAAKKIQHNNLLIGISKDNGKTWFFMETQGMSLDILRQMDPTLSNNLKLPKVEVYQNLD